MKTVISIILSLFVFLYISGIQISFTPFSIRLPYWYRGIDLLLIVLGFVFLNVGEYARGYQNGFKIGTGYYNKNVVENFKK